VAFSGFQRCAWALVAACAALPFGATAAAQVVDEVAIGAYAHSINNPWGTKEAGTQEIEVEIDTARPALLRAIGAPRIALTAAFNTDGKTKFGGAALAWDRRLWRRLSGTVQFGLDLNDGDVRAPPGPAGDAERRDRLQLGSRVLFREAAALNWRLTSHWNVGLQYIHNSNGEILGNGPNQSLNELGIRLGYRWGRIN
jgi:lipid A 3-O-deacylase